MNKSKLHSAVTRSDAYRRLGPRARSVYQVLWGLAGGGEETGEGSYMLACRARVETLAHAEACSPATVKRALADLEAAGLLGRARTGRASCFTLFVEAADAARTPSRAPGAIAHPCAIRGLSGEPSDSSSVSHRAAPSTYTDQDHSSKTTTPTRAAAVGAPQRGPEPEALDGAAAVAFEMLTGPSCPRRCRFVTPPERAQVRKLVCGLAQAGAPVVEVTRYAVAAAQEPGLRSPHGYVVAMLREPDLHAVYEHASRLRALEAGREARAGRDRAEADEARERLERGRARSEAAERAVAEASPAQLAAAASRAAGGAPPHVARQLRAASPEEIRRRPSLRGYVAAELLSQSSDAAVA